MYPSYDMILLRKNLIEEIVHKERSVNEVADILSVRRETVSRWLAKFRFAGMNGIVPRKPGPKKGVAANRTASDIEAQVIACARAHPFKGPVCLADELPFSLHPTTIYRILKRNGVRYGYGYHALKKKIKSYCLDRPGREVQMDICFPFGHQRDGLVYDAIDDCSRYVYAEMKVGHTNTDTIAFLTNLIAKAPFRIEAIRTDQEFSRGITEWLASKGIEHRRNPPYTPQHNGKIERYHRTFKELAVVYWPFAAELHELSYLLTQWLSFYNFHRKHSGLAMYRLTPVQKLAYAFISNSFSSLNVTGSLQQNII